MYSVVLMMALSGGGEAVDFGHRNGCRGGGGGGGCTGYVGAGYGASGCSGYAGAGYGGGCYGSGGGYACSGGGRGHGHHGLRGGCGGGGGLFSKHRNRCSGGGYGGGCSGGGYGGGCYGGGAVGTCYGGSPYGGAGCYGGGVIVPPATMGETPKAMPKEIKKTSIAVPATIVVSLPAAATLTVDGNPTTSTSAQRTLVTPALETDSTYIYTLQVRVNGQTQTQQVQVRGGQTTQAQFSFPQGVASR